MGQKDVIAAALEVGSSTLRVMAALTKDYAAVRRSTPLVEKLADRIRELECEIERGRNQGGDVAGQAETGL